MKKSVDVLLVLLEHQIREHPLPWQMERGWAYEVIASDKVVIAKYANQGQADGLIHLAEEIAAQKNMQRNDKPLFAASA